MGTKLHVDIEKDVMAEFNRLHAKHPHVSDSVKMQFAKDFVRTVAFADTKIVMQMVGLADR